MFLPCCPVTSGYVHVLVCHGVVMNEQECAETLCAPQVTTSVWCKLSLNIPLLWAVSKWIELFTPYFKLKKMTLSVQLAWSVPSGLGSHCTCVHASVSHIIDIMSVFCTLAQLVITLNVFQAWIRLIVLWPPLSKQARALLSVLCPCTLWSDHARQMNCTLGVNHTWAQYGSARLSAPSVS